MVGFADRCLVSVSDVYKSGFLSFSPISRQVPSYTSGEPNVFQRNSLVLKSLRNLCFSKWNGAQKRTRLQASLPIEFAMFSRSSTTSCVAFVWAYSNGRSGSQRR